MHQLDHPRAMDQRSQAMSVAGRAALFERIIDILARQHRERVSGDTQRLNEQQTITGILRMLDYEEPAEGATSKAAPPRPAAQQPPQLQCPNGHGLVDFNTTTCAGAPAALGRQQSGEGQRPRRCRSRRRSDDEHLLEGAEASRVKPKRVCRRGRSQSHAKSHNKPQIILGQATMPKLSLQATGCATTAFSNSLTYRFARWLPRSATLAT